MTEMLAITAIAMVVDIITGFAGAVKTGTVKSGKMREGLWHKGGFVGLVALSYMLEFAVLHIPSTGIEAPGFVDLCNFVASNPLVRTSCIYIVMTEAVSVLENLCVLTPAIADSPVGRFLAKHGADADEK